MKPKAKISTFGMIAVGDEFLAFPKCPKDIEYVTVSTGLS
jgi:hypothetical protein